METQQSFLLFGKLVIKAVQIRRRAGDVRVVPVQLDGALPAHYLHIQALPVGRQPLAAPVHVGIVASDAVRFIQKLPAGSVNRFRVAEASR